jgi:hypothetical protein
METAVNSLNICDTISYIEEVKVGKQHAYIWCLKNGKNYLEYAEINDADTRH